MTDAPPTVLVTGANSGIGLASVRALLDRGAAVIATVRSDKAETAVRVGAPAHASLVVERLDVTDERAGAALITRWRPDVLVNNAGHAELGGVMDVSDEEARAQFEALVVAPARLSRLLVESLRAEERGGRIVNVSSMLASADVPFTGWYSAAKAAARALNDALRLELRPSRVDVIRIDCGAVRTDAWNDAGDDVLDGTDETTASARRRWVDLTSLARVLFAEPDEVGRVIAAAATDRHPHPVYRVGFASRLGPLSRVVPTRIDDAITARVFGLRRP